jgi:hypothetical protein
LASGRNVTLCYVYRDRQEAWIAAGERTREEGAGRTITTHVHLSTHEGAAATIARLTAEFSKNPSVSFRRLDNSTALGLRPVDRAHTETAAPPKLAGEQLAALSPEDLADYVQRIAVAAVNQCRENKQLFLRQYPRLDFRGRELRPSPLLP